MQNVRIALLHLLPVAGDIRYNQQLIESAVQLAKNKKANWIITPELVVSGLQFSRKIGVDWIQQQPDEWMNYFLSIVKSLGATVFLGCPEKDEEDNLYNSVFVINQSGRIIGKQRKISSITDDWSTSGADIEPIEVGGVKVGVLICADAYTGDVANILLEKGAEMLIAPSSWGPGLYGPNGEWEQRSKETGLPVIVCNRTGQDDTVTFWDAESLIIKNGMRLLAHKADQSSIIVFDWDLEKMELISQSFEVQYLL